MLFFLTLTQSCNKACSYCGSDETNEFFSDIEDLSLHPRELQYDLDHLKNLAKTNDDLAICFYGGEPTLKPRVIYRVMDMMPKEKTVRYCLQTNGSLVHRMKPKYINQMETILMSLDGNREITDGERGEGSYDTIITNIGILRDRGFKGDMVGRMTISKVSDIYRDVTHLLNCGSFDHVHWQLDALWDSDMNMRWGDFLKWRDECYNPGITKLNDDFIEALKEDKVLPIAPFQGVLYTLIRGEKTELRCGSGLDAFNVTTGGKFTSCPIAPDMETRAELTEDFDPESIRNSERIGGACLDCDVVDVCGGRCLYANRTSWWGAEGFDHVCETIKHLINEMKRALPFAQEAIARGKVTEEDFHYPPFNNSVETIP